MEQKKAKKIIKIRDLKPTKDAKGGRGRGGGGYGIHRVQYGMIVGKSHRGSQQKAPVSTASCGRLRNFP